MVAIHKEPLEITVIAILRAVSPHAIDMITPQPLQLPIYMNDKRE